MDMIWNDIFITILQALIPVLTLFLISLVGYGISFLRAQGNKINSDVMRTTYFAAIDEAEKVAKDAISATGQTYVNEIKKAAADGKLTSEEKAQALQIAKDYFVTHISGDSLQILEAALGPIEEWLGGTIEAKLGQQKAGTVVNPT